MIQINLIDFQDCVNCFSQTQSSYESFLKISHNFIGGNAYGLVSDFGCGSWGVTTCVGGRCSDNPDGKIYFDGQPIPAKDLTTLSCFVSENIFEGINSKDNLLSAKECIEKALQMSKLDFTVEKIKNMFSLSDSRFERKLNSVSGEMWRISIAVGFAMGKETFCYPWLNQRDINNVDTSIIKELKRYGKIILIPSSQKKELKKICDHIIIFKEKKYIYK